MTLTRKHLIATGLRHLALFTFFLLLTWLSSIFQTSELRTTPWKPETGLAVAGGLILGRPAVLTIAAAIFISTRLWGWPLPDLWEFVSAAIRALVFTGSAAWAASLLMRPSMTFLQATLTFLAFSLALTVLYALVRLPLLMMSIDLDAGYVTPYTLTLSIGNLLGIITIVPLFLLRNGFEIIASYLRDWGAFQWITLSALVIISTVVFGIKAVDQLKFFYLIFLPVLAFTVRDGYVAASISLFLTDLIMMVVLYWSDYGASTATELQFLMLSLSATGLLLGAAITDHSRTAEELSQSYDKLQETQAALLQASRLSLASELAAALAHELNQPLSASRNFIRAVRRRLDLEQPDKAAIDADITSAIDQIDTASSLIRSTREFLERGSVQRSSIGLSNLLHQCQQLIQTELRRERISIVIASFQSLPNVVCNEVQIQQVIFNICKNAKDAIVLNECSQREIRISACLSARTSVVEVSIEDTGPGVSPNIRPYLFHPLRSSKPEGLGLGLSLCSTIIRSHGGDLWLDETSSRGARFVFTLPIFEDREILPEHYT